MKLKKEINYTSKLKQAKKGWAKMYIKDFAEISQDILEDNPFGLKILFYFMKNGYFKKDGSIKQFKQIDLAKELNTTRQRVSRAIKSLEKNEAIAKINGEWKYNPFMIGTTNMSDAQLYEAQEIWEKHIGHYITKK